MEWKERFTQQAVWTRELRSYLFRKADINHARRVLEVGCGPGVITTDVHTYTAAEIVGLDINLPYLSSASKSDRAACFTCGDALALPFANASCDIVYCHFLILWVNNHQAVIDEMVRIARPGGSVIALAEPDYGGRIDYPPALSELGELQSNALQMQGADPFTGRKLAGIFAQSGLVDVETGVLGGQWQGSSSPESRELEWKVLQSDLSGMLSADRLAYFRQIETAAWEKNERVLYVPTFYAWGKKEA